MPKNKIPFHCILGFLLILAVNIFLSAGSLLGLDIDILVRFYFPASWFGFVLFVDGLVYKFRGNSLIMDELKNFILLFLISGIIWIFFEVVANYVQGWKYVNIYEVSLGNFLLSTLVFSFILPAMLEVLLLINSLTKFKLETRKWKPRKSFLYGLILVGVSLLIIPIYFPEWSFPLIWVSLFLIFDPINYLNKQPSIIRDISNSEWHIPISLLISGIFIGFFWEFWNYWAYPKWARSIPFFDFYRLFDSSVLGYSLYFLFSWELFSMYHFIRWLGKSYLPKITNSIRGESSE
jgi:hypothetical protein